MFFFLSLRESAQGGRIEPDILPSSSSTNGLVNPSSSTKSPRQFSTSAFRSYITQWDLSDKPSFARRCVCLLAFVLHLPINILSIMSYGVSLWLFLEVVFSLLNLFCVGYALWKLDVMRGQRVFFNGIYKRHNFDYVILGLVLVYGGFFVALLTLRMTALNWHYFIRIVWPCAIAADIVCFIAGWVSTWRDITLG
ncbi:hypothetical protein ONS95_004512 [Cadophora gregata]|uniref:uncharacterized protein n=1 Tax=Cadophora gregata TaxID=51156 RepID=UPI0026DD0D57|nr:uncharacterized protein ONS95_004512 [Cadophora gregata]KAK0105126.1 hypothetical protein ONS96_004528 [Cadophora gregata f. sp. sojae]KAK0106005.1 hypothetical protein ONS95_004512 [Cadophora gregata]